MSDNIDTIRAERDRLQAELNTHRAALVQHPFQNTTVTPQMLERERAEKKKKVDAAMAAGLKREAAARAEREADVLAEGRQRLADYEGAAHQRFIHNGGSEGDWRAAWPAMKSAWLIEGSKIDPKERKIQEAAARLRSDPRYASF